MAANRHTYIHTHTSRNVVTLVWGSLRLAPITGQCLRPENTRLYVHVVGYLDNNTAALHHLPGLAIFVDLTQSHPLP